MASYHFRTKGYRAHTGQAIEHADYIMRRGRFADREDGVHRETLNMPSWAEEKPWQFWKAADSFERANGRAAREFELALPRELSKKEHIELVRHFVSEQLGNRHVVEFCIHDKQDGNPHAHIQYSERQLDGIERDRQHFFKQANKKTPERGGCIKEVGWNVGRGQESEKLNHARSLWADLQNIALAKAGIMARVDHRTLKAQGITRIPQIHVGPKNKARQNVYEKLRIKNEEIKLGNALADQLREVSSELANTQKELVEISDALQQLEAGSQILATKEAGQIQDQARQELAAQIVAKIEAAKEERQLLKLSENQNDLAIMIASKIEAAKADKKVLERILELEIDRVRYRGR